MTDSETLERKIGFDEVRTLVKGRCLSTLGTEWVDNHVAFLTRREEVVAALEQADEMRRFVSEEEGISVEFNIVDVRRALARIRPERTWMEEQELLDLGRSITTANAFITRINLQKESEEDGDAESDATDYPALKAMTAGLDACPALKRQIESILNKYGKIKDTASPELLQLRHSAEQTARSISHTLRTIVEQARSEGYIDRDVTPTLRDGRLVIPVAPALKRKIKGIVHDESATGKTIFIEPEAVVEANNRIRELKAAERREVIRILTEITAQIRPLVPQLLAMQTMLGHIDYLRALAAVSEAYDCIKPEVARKPLIRLRQAYHPLLRRALARHGAEMVPLNIVMPDDSRILLISGPNAGGKSVCLKTVGLLQYMTQCGMPIPVGEGSVMGLFKDIYIDIGDAQSIDNDLSTYSGHLSNMSRMLRQAGPQSLLLIDEFGSGTEPQIGGAMAEAIMERFVELGVTGVITTHYQNLKHSAQDIPAIVNGAMLYDRTKMQPLFVLQVGHPGSSFALEIARKSGLPEEVIARAADIVGQDYVMSDKYLLDIIRDKNYWENKRKTIHQREKKLEDTITRYESEMRTFEGERKAAMAQAKAEATDLIKQANAQIENTIRSIKEAQAEKERTQAARQELEAFQAKIHEQNDAEERIARKIAQIKRRQENRAQGKKKKSAMAGTVGTEAGMAGIDAAAQGAHKSKAYKVGDYVRMDGQTTVGRIVEMRGKEAKVVFGMVQAFVKLNRLLPATPPVEDNVTKAATFVSKETRDAMYEKKLQFKPEIDLRGMRADEALQAIAYFIDDAILLEQSRVRILHGTGTGALRELVRQYLSGVNGVKNYHDEHVQFGGAGITVAELA